MGLPRKQPMHDDGIEVYVLDEEMVLEAKRALADE